MGTTPQNYTSGIVTNSALVQLLASQWQTTWVGFGIDPDCHFYASGLELTVNTVPTAVPEPASMTLLGLGLAGAAAALRRRRRAFQGSPSVRR